jgi:predicted membrane protein
MKILSKHYHAIMGTLAKVVDVSAVVLWLVMIFEYISTNSIIYTASIIMMFFGSILVLFALLTYWYER